MTLLTKTLTKASISAISCRRQQGFSLVMALFILIVLASLGLYMVTISGTQQQSVNYTLLSARAYQAARSGIEWGIYQTINNGDCSGFPRTIDFSDNGLNGFQTVISCNLGNYQEKGDSFNIYHLTAASETDTASLGDLSYVSREIVITVTDVTP
ncbi:MAG TPA: pilus assembly protein MshP [Methylophaga sp.]|nr:pilus assembly protein MshP [Methylophaga sp.]